MISRKIVFTALSCISVALSLLWGQQALASAEDFSAEPRRDRGNFLQIDLNEISKRNSYRGEDLSKYISGLSQKQRKDLVESFDSNQRTLLAGKVYNLIDLAKRQRQPSSIKEISSLLACIKVLLENGADYYAKLASNQESKSAYDYFMRSQSFDTISARRIYSFFESHGILPPPPPPPAVARSVAVRVVSQAMVFNNGGLSLDQYKSLVSEAARLAWAAE